MRKQNKLLLNNNIKLSLFLITAVSALLFTSCTKTKPSNSSNIQSDAQDSTVVVQKNILPDTFDQSRTIQDKWNDFYRAKDSVDAAAARNDFDDVRKYLKKAYFHAMEVSRPDIAAWQLNNIGYYSIVEFKQKTDYDERMRTIENMRRGPEKIVYIKETKALFKKYLPKLLDSVHYLEEAYDLDKDFNDNDRTNKIYSNLAYIDWVRNFTLEE